MWSTKERIPFLKSEIRGKVFNHIVNISSEKGYFIDSINGFSDHVHILMSLHPKYSISEAVNSIKGESSHWINSERLTRTHFSWQDGYSVFSVSESVAGKVREYINNQERHHAKQSFSDELRKLLELHKVG